MTIISKKKENERLIILLFYICLKDELKHGVFIAKTILFIKVFHLYGLNN